MLAAPLCEVGPVQGPFAEASRLHVLACLLASLVREVAVVEVTLSKDDRALLREVFTWARANGWGVAATDRDDRQWSADDDGTPVVCLRRPNYGDNGEDRFGPAGLRVYFFGGRYRCVDVPASSVREAVDVLAALGVLPAQLSSQWRAAADSMKWHYSATLHDGDNGHREFGTDAEAAFAYAAMAEGYPQLPVLRQRRGPWQRAVMAGV